MHAKISHTTCRSCRTGLFLTDGGMETTLIFHEGVELPHFASFVLLDTRRAGSRLKRYYERYLAIARERGVGFVLDSPTWRANPDWGAKLGYDAARARRRSTAARSRCWKSCATSGRRRTTPCVISGAIGPRGDGYKAGNMDAAEAEAYHAAQIAGVRRKRRRHGDGVYAEQHQRGDRHRARGARRSEMPA